MPCWVPDWTAEQYGKPFSMSCIHFNAAGDKRKSFSVTENILRITVVLIDEVTSLTPYIRDRDNLDGSTISSWPIQLHQWIAAPESMISQVDPYPSGETIETAFWKTLVCDNGPDGDAITEEYLTHFKAYKKFIGFLSKSESTTNGLDDKNSAI